VALLQEGGVENIVNALQFVANICLKQPTTHYHPNQSLALVSIQEVGSELDVLSGIGDNGSILNPYPYSLPYSPKLVFCFIALIT